MANEKQKQYYTERYNWLKQHGICVGCGQDYACINSVFCTECGEKRAKQWLKRYHANHEENKEKRREYNKRIYAERKAKGLCVRCGRKALDGLTVCFECRIKYQKWRKKKSPWWNNDTERAICHENDTERSMRPELGLCYICGKPLNKWEKLCDDCHEKASERMKNTNTNPTGAMIRARKEHKKRYNINLYYGKKQKGEEK